MGWQDDPVVGNGGWRDDPIIDEPKQSSAKRSFALGAREVIEGALSLPAMITDGAAALASVLPPPLGPGRNPLSPSTVNTNASIQELLDRAGFPTEQADSERLMGAGIRGASGAISTAGTGALMQGAKGLTQSVGNALATQPVLQTISGGTGAVSSEYARQNGAGPLGQFAAGIAGAAAPVVISSLAPAAVRGGFRGGEQGRQRVERNIDTFRRAGTTPTVGQATESRTMRAAESALSKVPGSAGVMSEKATTQADELGAQLDTMAGSLAPKASGEQAGRAIEKGISGSGGFLEYFKGKAETLYNAIDQYIAPDAPVSVQNTQVALAELTAVTPGAQATTGRLVNPRIAQLSADLSQDAATGVIPYSALKAIRTRVGSELADGGLTSDVPAAQWKRLYAALSSDLEAAASSAGPQAEQAFSRANAFYRAGQSRIDAISHVVERNGGPERIFQAATNGTKEGASTLRAVMQSLPEEGQKTVAATILRRLGRAKAGVQDAGGEAFSTETFLTNWAGLSGEAKRVITDRFGAQFRSDMDQIAKVAANLRAGSQVFRNPSGTGQATSQIATVSGFVSALFSGHPVAAAGIAGGVGAVNRIAKNLMVNPRFVRWLASTTKMPTAQLPVAANQLAIMARKTNDPDILALSEALRQQVNQTPNDQRGKDNRQ